MPVSREANGQSVRKISPSLPKNLKRFSQEGQMDFVPRFHRAYQSWIKFIKCIESLDDLLDFEKYNRICSQVLTGRTLNLEGLQMSHSR